MARRKAPRHPFRSLVPVLAGIGSAGFASLAAAQDFGSYPGYQPEHGWLYYLGIVALSAIAGALFGAFLSDKAKPFRRILWLVMIGIGLLVALVLSWTARDVIAFLVGFIVAHRLLAIVKKRGARARDTTFGSAEWATLAHLQERNVIGDEGFFLGLFDDPSAERLHYTGDRHLLTVAPTRSGKGTSTIVPNLLTYQGSALVIDPKGENARMTALRRGDGNNNGIPGMKQQVHVVDPWAITGLPVSRFNPLDWIASDEVNSSENAMMLADSIVIPRGGNADPFWDEEAKALLMGLILFVASDQDEDGKRTLGRVRDIIVSDFDQLSEVLGRMAVHPNPIAQSTAARTVSKDEKMRSGVLASLQSHTHFLDSPAIRANLSASDFKFEDLKTSKMTVYLVLPADRLDTFGRWLRVLVQQAITVNARNIEHTPDKPILFMLDEMSALGKLSMVEQAYGLMAGFGMQLWGIVQDLAQLERIYDKGWETFIGNSGVLQYFGSRDHRTAEYFSKLCGVTTMEKFSFTAALADAFSSTSGTSSGQGGLGSNSSTTRGTTNTHSTTRDVVQRHLAYPDELMVMREARQLILIENYNPIRGKRLSWLEDPKRRELGINLRAPAPLRQLPEPMVKIPELVAPIPGPVVPEPVAAAPILPPVFCTKCGLRHEDATCPRCGAARRSGSLASA
jgi:type IV secretion system protein VirD4